jgi:hypothetical protein
MESVHKLEKTIAEWYKNVPHLPKNIHTWLADNAWWIVAIGAVLSALGAFTVLSATLFVGSVLTGAGYGYSSVAGAAVASATGVALVAALLSVASLVVSAVLFGLAVSPLKAHKKKGWDYVFAAELIAVAVSVVSVVVSFNVGGLVSAVVGAAIGFYFLFEVRGHFGGHIAGTKKVAEKAKEDKK